jgi:hypothetical protein
MRSTTSMLLAVTLVCGTVTSAVARSPTRGAANNDCFEDLMRGRSDEIVCQFPVRPSATERAELEKTTRGYVKNAQCQVAIRITRAEVSAAINNPDYVFLAPPQPVACEVTTAGKAGDSVLPITATFAPKVTIKDGKAIDATPGLGNVTGVPRALSWPVEAWVNSGIGIKGNMLMVINAWLDHMRNDQPKRQAMR